MFSCMFHYTSFVVCPLCFPNLCSVFCTIKKLLLTSYLASTIRLITYLTVLGFGIHLDHNFIADHEGRKSNN